MSKTKNYTAISDELKNDENILFNIQSLDYKIYSHPLFNIDECFVIGVTGSTKVVYKIKFLKDVEVILAELKEHHGDKLIVINCLANGVDLLFSKVAKDLKIPIVAILPMKAEDYKNKYIFDEYKALYDEILAYAYQSIVTKENLMHPFFNASKFVVENSNLMCASVKPNTNTKYDAKTDTVGGTNHVIEMAKAKGVEILYINLN